MNVTRVVSLLAFFALNLVDANAAARAVKFKSDIIPLKAIATQEFNLDLKSLLTDAGSGNLQWSAAADKPAFLTIDSANSRMFGLPKLTDAGLKTFRLGVQDGDTGAFARIDLSIVIEPIWQQGPLNLGVQKEGTPFTFDLKTKVIHPAGGVLTFAVARGRGLPKWMSLAANGILSGTPRRDDVGNYSGIIFIARTESGGEARMDAFGKVEKTVVAPKWTANPITLDNANEDFPYSKDVSGFVIHTEGSPLIFKLTQGATSGWLKIGGTGSLFGTPGKVDLGDVSVKAEVSTVIDGVTYKDETTLKFKVIHTNHSPAWNSDPVILPQAITKKPYTQDLKGFATDPDGDRLTFKLVGVAPKWAAVSADGILTGTPQNANLGVNKFTVEVSDGEFSPSAIVQITVVNRPPVWLAKPTVLPGGKEDALYSQNLVPLAVDPDGDTLSFTLVAGPSWATVSSAGVISGTPKAGDLGLQKFKVRVADSVSGSDEAEVQINIEHVNHAPRWTQDPVLLGNTPEKALFSSDLNRFVVDSDAGDKLTITKLSGPAWASIDGAGKIAGTPDRIHVGVNDFKVRVTDSAGLFAEATVRINVDKVNKAPIWLEDPLQLGTLTEETPFAFDLKPKAQDPDGDAITFKKLTGPTWITVGADGKLAATPPKGAVGAFSGVVEVSDGTAATQATYRGTVQQKNYPPTINEPALSFIVKERQVFAQALTQFVTDPNGDPLTFTLIDTAAWVSLSATGALQLKPLFPQIGDHTFKFKVSDGKLEAQGSIKVRVQRDPRAPVWVEDPIRFTANEGQAFAASIADKAQDLDGLPLTFSKKSGPAWLSITANGQLAGTPLLANVGANNFVLTVRNDALGSDTNMIITVTAKPNKPPVWLQDPIALADAISETPYNFDIAQFAMDPDGDPLTFKKVSRANWLTVATNGRLTGTPAKTDVGNYTVTFEVSDGRLTAQAKGNGKVLKKNTAPVVKAPPASFVVKERAVLTDSLNQTKYVEDLEGDTLTFTLLNKKAKDNWLTLGTDGKLTMKPLHADIGDYTFNFQVSDGVLNAQGTFLVKVLADPRPPVWLEDPIRFTANEGQAFTASLANKAQDLDGLPLTFSKKSGPAWLTVGANGALSGTPVTANVGDNTFVVTVRNPTLGADGNVIVTVVAKPNRPPVWLQDPIALADALSETPYSFDIAQFAMDPDGDPLTFKKISKANWLTVAANGRLGGSPAKADVGNYTVTFEVSDGRLTAQAKGNGRVVAKNTAPVVKTPGPTFVVKERAVLNDTLNQTKWVEDAEGDTLTFTLLDPAAWVTLGTDGKISLKPLHPQIGEHSFRFRVGDGTLNTEGTIKVSVVADPRPPVWLEDPIRFTANEGQPFTASLANKVQDLDGLPLTFSKKTGPAWLTVSANGALSGTPVTANIGENSFVVTVRNPALGADGNVIVTVVAKPNRPPVWLQDPMALADALQDTAYSFDIAQFAMDPDGDPLTFKKISKANWLTVASNGRLGGTPAKIDVGNFTATFEVSDGRLSAQAKGNGRVVAKNNPPVIKASPSFVVKERAILNDTLNQAKWVEDVDGDTLTFTLLDAAAWVTLGTDGKITLKPLHPQIGEHSFRFRVADGTFNTEGTMKVSVLADPRPPVWLEDPIRFTANEGQTFSATLADKVQDLDGAPLTFSKKSGPAWLIVNTNGAIAGTPVAANLGANNFVVTATNATLGADVNVIITVVGKPNRPPVWTQDPIPLADATVGTNYAFDISRFATDPDGDPLTFKKVVRTRTPADWMSVSTSGALSGVPQKSHVGNYEVIFEVSDGKAAVRATGKGKVVEGIKPPIWLEDPIRFEASVGVPFSQTLAGKAQDLNGLSLTFSKKSGPGWLIVAGDGNLSGTPASSNLGDNIFAVSVTNGTLSADATLIVRVTNSNKPPRWTKNPIPLGDYQAGSQAQFDLSVLAVDDDGDPLTFKKVTGPTWTNVSGGGMFYGLPQLADVGEFTMQIEVSDGKATAIADAFGKVISNINKPPVIKPEALSFIVQENEVFRVNINQPQYVVDPEGDALTFQLLASSTWITLAAPGDLELKPLKPQVGDHKVSLRVTDSKGNAAEGLMSIRVLPANPTNPPIWIEDPIRMEATVNVPFSNSLAGKALDPSGSPLAFSKVSGPNWLIVNQNGALGGTPAQANLGENTFRVKVTNATGQSAEGTLIVTVKPGGGTEQEDEIAIDKVVPGAPAENLWVVDNSWPWLQYNRLVRLLKEEIHVYYEELNNAQVHHMGAFLSSDNTRWNGNPIQGDDSSLLLRWDDNRLPQHFISRVDEVYNKKCSTSPIWAMNLFYGKAPSISQIYHNGYFTEGVPMDVMILTNHSDSYRSSSKGTQYAGDTPNDYVDRFIKFHQNEKQPYRINAIAPDCQVMLDPTGEDPQQTSAENPYRTLVRRTNGQYFSWDCHFDMEKTLKAYAKQVIFRAHVAAKRRIPLSKTPTDINSVKVFLAGQALPANQWRYDSAKNEVIIEWQLIDMSKLKPGDLIEIRYKA